MSTNGTNRCRIAPDPSHLPTAGSQDSQSSELALFQAQITGLQVQRDRYSNGELKVLSLPTVLAQLDVKIARLQLAMTSPNLKNPVVPLTKPPQEELIRQSANLHPLSEDDVQ